MNPSNPVSQLSRRQLATSALGLFASFGMLKAAASETKHSDPLAGWTARQGQGATAMLNPSYIDDSAAEDLAFYHPVSLQTREYLLKHVAARDSQGPYARTVELSDNWNEKMAEVMFALKLRPERIQGVDVLVDRTIRTVKTREMHGWKVTQWLVVKNIGPDLSLLHQDYITWEKGNLTAMSMVSWRPYV